MSTFREAFDVGPHRFLALRRLAGARRMLQQAGTGITVTEAATRWGFFHLGRFARDYRLLYGERPSETRARQAGTRPDKPAATSAVEGDATQAPSRASPLRRRSLTAA